VQPRVIVTTAEAIPAKDLLARAERELELGELEAAARDFELLLVAGASRPLEARIRLGYARALEGMGELERATGELERRVVLVPEADAARLELLPRLLLLERFAEAGVVARAVSGAGVSPADQVLLSAALSLAQLAAGEPGEAEAALAPAWALWGEASDRERGPLGRSTAWVSFASGEIAAEAARQVGFDPVPDDVARVLEVRCRHMVAAQSAYAEAMRLQSGRLRLIAGQRIAVLYLELHRDILAAPLPRELSGTRQRPVAKGALLLRYEVLLEKAEQMLRITLEGTKDTMEARPVRRRVENALADVVTQRAAHAAEVEGLPASRDELRRILESLGAPSTAGGAGLRPVQKRDGQLTSGGSSSP